MSTPSSSTPASPWELIDGILVINLDTCPERMDHFREVNAMLPTDKVHRLSACYGRTLPGFGEKPWFTERTAARAGYWGGVAGCIISHRRAIETAKQRGWRNVLVLEDDVEFVKSPAAADALRRTLETLSGKYMLYLGYSRPNPYGTPVMNTEEHTLWKVDGVLSTYAYLVSAPLYDDLLERMPDERTVWEWTARHRAIDTFYRDIAARLRGVSIYAVLPDIVNHVDGAVSSISGHVEHYKEATLHPLPLNSFRGLLHRLLSPLRCLKVSINAQRTYLRARRGGFPGFRAKKH